MADVVYEFAVEAPTGSIVDLYRAAGWWKDEPGEREAIPALIAGSFCFLLARDPSGRIVGMGRALSDGASDAWIQDVTVLPVYRGRGIGREIVSRLARRCVEAGLTWIGLVAEPGTRAFYEPLGFSALDGFQPMLYRRPERT